MREFNEKISVHNRFDVEVRDAKTGKIKSRAQAFNVVLDQYFTLWWSPNKKWNYGQDPMAGIAIGTGAGTPAITDTGLFSQLAQIMSTNLGSTYAYPTSYRQVQVTLAADQYNGNSITEVGLVYNYVNIYQSEVGAVITHAMLKDSEGNPIAINKTDSDVIIITATFYVTYITTAFGTNGIYPEANKNDIFNWMLNAATHEGGQSMPLRTSRRLLSYSSDMFMKYTFTKDMIISNGANSVSGRIDMPLTTILTTEGLNKAFTHIGSPGVGAFKFPNHDIFPPYAVTHLPLGSGDGVKTDFNIGAPLIMEGSLHVYVNSVEWVEGVDYTAEYDNNCVDQYEAYWTADMTALDTGVTFGYMALTTKSSTAYGDPMFFGAGQAGPNMYPNSFTVSSENPIIINFGLVKKCNSLKFELNVLPTDQLDNMKVQYSSDGTTWTDVAGLTRIAQAYKWTAVSAQYWRVYINGYNWWYPLYYGLSYVEEVVTYSSFYLGYTSPGLHFITPPTSGAAIDASYSIDVPYHTANNTLKFVYSIVLSRG